MPIDPDQTATIVSSRAIRAGHGQDFERWVEELNRHARAAPGYRAAIRLGQTAGFQHLLFRFDDRSAAETWHDDPKMSAHVANADRFSTALRQIEVGDGVTFDLPSDASANKWKRFVTTWLTVFPVLLVISMMVRTALEDAPLPLQLLPSSLLFTASLQQLILPRPMRERSATRAIPSVIPLLVIIKWARDGSSVLLALVRRCRWRERSWGKALHLLESVGGILQLRAADP